jgi:hypothetical protein
MLNRLKNVREGIGRAIFAILCDHGFCGLFFTAKSLRNDSGEGQAVDGDTRRGHAAQPSRGHGDVGQLYVTGLDFARG